MAHMITARLARELAEGVFVSSQIHTHTIDFLSLIFCRPFLPEPQKNLLKIPLIARLPRSAMSDSPIGSLPTKKLRLGKILPAYNLADHPPGQSVNLTRLRPRTTIATVGRY